MRILNIEKLKNAKCPFFSPSNDYNQGWNAALSLIIENPDEFMIENGPSQKEKALQIYIRAWGKVKRFIRGIAEFDGAIEASSMLKVMDRYLDQEVAAEEEPWPISEK